MKFVWQIANHPANGVSQGNYFLRKSHKLAVSEEKQLWQPNLQTFLQLLKSFYKASLLGHKKVQWPILFTSMMDGLLWSSNRDNVIPIAPTSYKVKYLKNYYSISHFCRFQRLLTLRFKWDCIKGLKLLHFGKLNFTCHGKLRHCSSSTTAPQ